MNKAKEASYSKQLGHKKRGHWHILEITLNLTSSSNFENIAQLPNCVGSVNFARNIAAKLSSRLEDQSWRGGREKVLIKHRRAENSEEGLWEFDEFHFPASTAPLVLTCSRATHKYLQNISMFARFSQTFAQGYFWDNFSGLSSTKFAPIICKGRKRRMAKMGVTSVPQITEKHWK